jgi:hypothetical protein
MEVTKERWKVFLKWRCSIHKIKSKDTKEVWIVTVEREKLRAYDAMSRRHTGEVRASHFLASISATLPRLWWSLRPWRVGKPRFQPVYIPYATRFVLGRLGFNLPVVAMLHGCCCCLHFIAGSRVEDIGATGCRAPFGTRCFGSFTSGSVKLSFPLFAKVWALSAFLIRVVDGVGSGKIIFWSSVSWSAVADPSSSPFLHMSAIYACSANNAF